MGERKASNARYRGVLGRVVSMLLVAGVLVGLTAVGGQAAVDPRVTPLSLNADDRLANGDSEDPAISAGGAYVAFSSTSTELINGDTNGVSDIFVLNTETDVIERVSVSSSGAQANGASSEPAISSDGRYVTFTSAAENLDPAATGPDRDVYIHDRNTDRTWLVSRWRDGAPFGRGQGGAAGPSISGDGRLVAMTVWFRPGGPRHIYVVRLSDGRPLRITPLSPNGDSGGAKISADGSFVGFTSIASNIVGGDTNGTWDAFVATVSSTPTIDRITPRGIQPNGATHLDDLSADGRWVALSSKAGNLVAPSPPSTQSVYRFDRTSRAIALASRATNGSIARLRSFDGVVSDDGRLVLFSTVAPNLSARDTDDKSDVYARDFSDNTTGLVSNSFSDDSGRRYSGRTDLTGDGRWVALASLSSRLSNRDDDDQSDVFLIDLQRGAATPPTCQGRRATITGSGTINGTSRDDVIVGSAGADTIRGRGGSDLICAGGGNDTIDGGDGRDDIDGGDGNDTVTYASSGSGVIVILDDSANDGTRGEGDNVRSSVENVIGSAYNDRFIGSDAANEFRGGGGRDVASGGVGNDRLHGESGRDVLAGGPGNDILRGNAGDDLLFGDGGNDLCVGSSGFDFASAGCETKESVER